MHEVSGHFYHLGERPATCTNETIRHKAAKHAVKNLRVFEYDVKCVSCEGMISVDTAEEGSTTHDEHSWGSYRLDVAFVADGRVGGAVEIYETHKIPDEKAEALTRDDIAWVEVTAEEVLRRVRLGGDFSSSRVPALRCAAVECQECEAKRIRRTEEKTRERIEKEAEAERKISRGIPRLGTRQFAEEHEAMIWKTIEAEVKKAVSGRDAPVVDEVVTEKVTEMVTDARRIIEDTDLYHGKHGKPTGKSVREVWEDDPAYVRWLAGYSHSVEKNARGRPAPVRNIGRDRCPLKCGFTKHQVETAGKILLEKRVCYSCLDALSSHEPSWKTMCKSCYASAF